MSKGWGIVQDSQGNAVNACEIKVYLAGTSTLASIFSDSALSVAINQATSPVTTDATGHYQFFVASGSSVKLVGTKGTFTFTEDHVDIGFSVPAARTISTTSPLTGGGDFSANRTLGFDAFFDVRAYGAVGDGVTDDAAAIQAAIDAAEAAGGGVVFFQALDFAIESTLTVNQPVLLVGAGCGEATNNGSGSSTATTKLKWTGSSGGGPMIKFVSAVAGEWITAGGVENLFMDANLNATGCIWADSAKHMVFGRPGGRLRLRNAQSFGLKISSENGVLAQFCFIHADYRVGQAANTSHGLYIDCTTAAQTQHQVSYWAATVVDGDAMRIEGFIDSSRFYRVGGTVTGTGRGVVLLDAGTGTPQKNVFYYVNGDFHAGGTSYGNEILHFNSEGKSLTADAGARIHYSTVDWTHGDRFETHTYPMAAEIALAAASFGNSVGTATLGGQGVWSAWNLPDASTGRIASSAGVPPWANGSIVKVRVHFTKGSASVSANVVLAIDVTTKALGNVGISTPDHQSGNLTVPVRDGVRVNDYYDYAFGGSPVAFARGDHLMVSLQRVGADASDTLAMDLGILAVTIFYESNGPDSAGTGTYDITLPYLV